MLVEGASCGAALAGGWAGSMAGGLGAGVVCLRRSKPSFRCCIMNLLDCPCLPVPAVRIAAYLTGRTVPYYTYLTGGASISGEPGGQADTHPAEAASSGTTPSPLFFLNTTGYRPERRHCLTEPVGAASAAAAGRVIGVLSYREKLWYAAEAPGRFEHLPHDQPREPAGTVLGHAIVPGESVDGPSGVLVERGVKEVLSASGRCQRLPVGSEVGDP